VNEANRFWSKVDRSGKCWVWTASTAAGYGAFRRSNPRRQEGAHRVSWELVYGPIPKGWSVLHMCDNKLCVRPTHLFIGDARTNAQDASAKGLLRGRRRGRQDGDYNNQAKLSWEAARSLRADWATGKYTADTLGEKYRVSRTTAWRAATGRSFGRDEEEAA
jgi:hypothetical protein